MTQGFFSLIQSCPDASRAESANVGLMIIQVEPPATAVRVVDDVRPVLKRLGYKDDAATMLAVVQSMKNRIERERFESLEALEKFVRTRGNQIQLTMPRPMLVEAIDRDLEEMFEELVGAPQPVAETPAASKAPPLLLQAFVEFERRVPTRVQIRPVFLVPDLGISFRADYAYRNGHLNVVQEVSKLSDTDVVRNAFALSKESELVGKIESGGRLVVVSTMVSHSRKALEREREFGEMLGKLSDAEFVPSERVEQFAKRVERELSDHS